MRYHLFVKMSLRISKYQICLKKSHLSFPSRLCMFLFLSVSFRQLVIDVKKSAPRIGIITPMSFTSLRVFCDEVELYLHWKGNTDDVFFDLLRCMSVSVSNGPL